jgi:hypothetical protein
MADRRAAKKNNSYENRTNQDRPPQPEPEEPFKQQETVSRCHHSAEGRIGAEAKPADQSRKTAQSHGDYNYISTQKPLSMQNNAL